MDESRTNKSQREFADWEVSQRTHEREKRINRVSHSLTSLVSAHFAREHHVRLLTNYKCNCDDKSSLTSTWKKWASSSLSSSSLTSTVVFGTKPWSEGWNSVIIDCMIIIIIFIEDRNSLRIHSSQRRSLPSLTLKLCCLFFDEFYCPQTGRRGIDYSSCLDVKDIETSLINCYFVMQCLESCDRLKFLKWLSSYRSFCSFCCDPDVDAGGAVSIFFLSSRLLEPPLLLSSRSDSSVTTTTSSSTTDSLRQSISKSLSWIIKCITKCIIKIIIEYIIK